MCIRDRACKKLKDEWINWQVDTPCPFNKSDLDNFQCSQIIEFLSQLLDEKTAMEIEKLAALQQVYDFNSVKNAEIRFRFLNLKIYKRVICFLYKKYCMYNIK